MKGRNFPSQNQACMIYKDLCESYSLCQERTQYFMHGDQCFGHLPVVGCLLDEDVCKILSQGNCVSAHFRKHSHTAKCIFVTGKETHYLNFSHKCLPNQDSKNSHSFFRPSASHVNNSNDHHEI